jgi:alpha,alpha-trehalase
MTLAYAQQGDHLTAARWFERNRAACGPPGLWEEFDVTQRQLDGNLPQAISSEPFPPSTSPGGCAC